MANPKEYLFKRIDGSYHIIDHDCQGRAIEIPDGAEFALMREYDGYIEFRKSNMFFDNEWKNGLFSLGNSLPLGISVIWQRHTQPEELLFVDDKPKNVVDDVIDIMCGKHREWFTNTVDAISKENHNHYFKDVSDIDSIDVYEVLFRFGVTDPCLQHIVKKALCIGQRGHKSLHTDMKDIHDTAVRMLAMHGIV